MDVFEFYRDVTVAGRTMELNATNAEVIFGTIIDEANNGEIDLNGFRAFWNFVRQELNATLGATETELQPVAIQFNLKIQVSTHQDLYCSR
jgi:hypothetical protein